MTTAPQPNLKGYELREEIGIGGFGVVYRAFQPVIERDVVIKVILPKYANRLEFIRSFETEAQTVARLEHPYIVPLYDYWRDPQGAYLVMRMLRGGNLSQYLKQGHPPNIPLVGRWLDQITSALYTAHRHQVVHRDLKPANILLDEDQNAYLTDFGIAKSTGTHNDEGEISGSIGYIAPEQLEGGGAIPESDVYSLGIMLYEMLTGEHPFGEVSFSQMALKHLKDPLPDLPNIPPHLPSNLNPILQRATAKLPHERYSDVRQMAQDFRRALQGDSGSLTLDQAERIYHGEISNPYKGLRAFEEADAGDFYGREGLIEQILERMRYDRFLAVVGPSGSGKSSVIRAGVIPGLRQGGLPLSDQWFMVEMLPGSHPIENLVAALLSVAVTPPANLAQRLRQDPLGLLNALEEVLPDLPNTEEDPPLLLFIDQFEEVFTLVESEAERTHFLELLRAAILGENSRLRVICSLRADFYDKPLLYEGFGALMQERTQVVLPLTSEEIRRTIVKPAEGVGLQVESDLVAAIIADLRDEPGALPLLQYTLTELFERREGYVLTLATYHHSGGVFGALARRAQEVYDDLDLTQQSIARQMFLRLVTLGEGTEDTRRRVLRAELVSAAGQHKNRLDEVLGVYSKYRLLTFDLEVGTRQPTVEVAHEAIIREWQLLRRWLEESRHDIRQQRLLAVAASDWAEAKHDPSYLLRDARLSQYEEWASQTDLPLTQLEEEFLDQSIAAQNVQEQAEHERQQREFELESRARNRSRWLMAALAVSIGGLILTSLAFWQRSEALTAEDEARQSAGRANTQAAIASTARNQSDILAETAIAAQYQAATSEAAASNLAEAGFAQQVFLLNNDTDLGIALALEANKDPNAPPLVRDVLVQIGLAPGTRRLFQDDRVTGFWLATFTPDGRHVLTGTYDGIAALWDVETGQISQVFDGHSHNTVGAVAVSPDGEMVATGSEDNAVMLWSSTTQRRLATLYEHRAAVWSVDFSHDGQYLVSSSADGRAIIWDLATMRPRYELPHETSVLRAVFSPDGRYVATGTDQGGLRLWNAQTSQIERELVGHTGEVWYLAFTPDSQRLLSGVFTLSEERRLLEWEVATGQTLYSYEDTSTNSSLNSFALSADGRFAAIGLIDGSFKIWDLREKRIIATYKSYNDTIYGLAFSPDGQRLFSGSIDGTGRLWDLTNGAQINEIDLGLVTYSLATIPNQPQQLLMGSEDGQVRLWDLQTEQTLASFPQIGIIRSVAVSPDGLLMASASSQGSIALWDLATGQQRHLISAHEGPATRLIFSPDGQQIISSGEDTLVKRWDVANAALIQLLQAHLSPINALVMSADGQTIASGADAGNFDQNTLVIWEASTGRPRYILNPGSLEALAFHPDQRTLAVGLSSGGIELWDAVTGMRLSVLQGHSSNIEALSFNADGTQLLSASADRTLIVWDMATGQLIRRIYGHTNAVISALFSTDGQSIFSSAYDASIRQWQLLPTEALLDWVEQNRYVRPLTCGERELYNIAPFCPPDSTPNP
jgi:WD40 repeat protein